MLVAERPFERLVPALKGRRRVAAALATAAVTLMIFVPLGLFRGGVLTVVFHGLASALGYWIFGVRPVVLLAAVTALAAFIPFIGTLVVWIPLSLGLWLGGHPYRALGLCLCGLLVVGGADYVFRPFVSRGRMAIPRLLLFLTIFGGLQLFGAKGLLLGPLVGSLAVVAARLLDRARPAG